MENGLASVAEYGMRSFPCKLVVMRKEPRRYPVTRDELASGRKGTGCYELCRESKVRRS